MMSIRIMSKLQNLLFVLLLFAMTGCGASNSKIAGTDGNPSSKITAKFNWAADGKSTAKAVAAVPAGVVSVRLRITGPYQIPGDTSTASRYTAAKATFPAAAGSGSIAVFPGTGLIVIAEALDAGDTVLYEGIVSSLNGAPIAVAAGATTDLGTITIKAPPVKEADKPCLACHENSRDANGNSLVANYKTSRHYNITASPAAKFGVNSTGCAGCHGPQHNDLTPAAGGFVSRCFECHNAGGNLPSLHKDRFYTKIDCTVCHSAHTLAFGEPEKAALALSGHGNPSAWPVELSGSCTRCHTNEGYIAFAANQTVFTQPTLTTGTMLGCTGCHTSDNNSVRQAGAFTPEYQVNTINGAATGNYPDVKNSNLCIDCHSARNGGATIWTSTADFTNTTLPGSHYAAAAATMYMSNAFVNFTTMTAPAATNNELNADGTKATFASTKPYAKNNLPDNLSVPSFGIAGGTTSAHRRVGTPLIAGSETYLPAGGIAITTNGPCVTCHIQGDNPVAGDSEENKDVPVPAARPGFGHSFKIDEATAAQTCIPCHGEQHLDGGDGKGNALYTATHDLATLTSAQIAPQRECFENGLGLLKKILLTKYMIKYDPVGSHGTYLFDLQKDPTGVTPVTDWTRKNVAGVTDAAVAALGATFTPVPAGGLTQVQAKRLMGACFNLVQLDKEPAAFVHSRSFTQRVVYDALDYLDNNTMDFTALTSSRALNPTIYHGTNVNVFASDGTLATESMIWMSGTHYGATKSTSATKGTDLVPMKLHP